MSCMYASVYDVCVVWTSELSLFIANLTLFIKLSQSRCSFVSVYAADVSKTAMRYLKITHFYQITRSAQRVICAWLVKNRFLFSNRILLIQIYLKQKKKSEANNFVIRDSIWITHIYCEKEYIPCAWLIAKCARAHSFVSVSSSKK